MKIILTLGNEDDIKKHEILVENIISSDSDMVRCCVSKASFENHIGAVTMVKDLYRKKTGKELFLMLDVPIPKDKNRIFVDEEKEVHEGDYVYLNSGDNIVVCDAVVVRTNANIMKHDINDEFVIGDSQIILKTTEIISPNILKCCVCNQYGVIKSGLGIASKQGCIDLTATDIVEKSQQLIETLRPECIILSYVENENDVISFREKICQDNYNPIVMSKIETYTSVINRKQIIRQSDEIMIARGCLAVNVGLENLMIAQDCILDECFSQGRNVCVASNILKTMSIQNAPNRADIIDLTYMIQRGVRFLVITDSISRTYKCRELMRYIKKVDEATKHNIFRRHL